jgi:uracil-DNA glycosylase
MAYGAMTSTSPPSSPAGPARGGRPGSLGGPPIDDEERWALAELVGELRASIERHYRAGRWAASAGLSPRYAVAQSSAASQVAAARAPAAAEAQAAAEAPPAPIAASGTPSAGASLSASGNASLRAPATAPPSAPTSGRARGPEPADGRFDDVPLDDAMGPPPDEGWGGAGMPDFDDAPPAWAASGGRGAATPRPAARTSSQAPAAPPALARDAAPARQAPPASQAPAAAVPSFFDAPLAPAATFDADGTPRPRKTLATVRADLGDCQRCKLAQSRNKIVFGAGAEDAPLVFVGEAPGADEDRTGEPFVGKAGQLLDKMIEAMGWSRGSVYIANLLKCRPPGNRNPEADEAAACRPFLISQLEVLAPRIIVALGRPSANALLSVDAPISTLRGKFHERMGLKIMPSFHPAYLLRDPGKKREAWADLQLVMAELARIGVAPRR